MKRLSVLVALLLTSIIVHPVFAASLSRCAGGGCDYHRIYKCVHCYRQRVHLCDPIFARHSSVRYSRSCTGYYHYTYDWDASPTDNLISSFFYSPED